MSVAWTIQRNGGEPAAPATYGIDRILISRKSMAVSEMTFTVRKADIFDEPAFSFGDVIILWRDAVIWFLGRVSQLPAVGASDNETQRYVISDLWLRLQRIVYQQPFVLQNGTFTGLVGSYTSHVTLGQDPWGFKLSTDQQISAIGVFGGVAIGAGLPSLSPTYLQDARDITCADAIRKMTALNPDCVSWFIGSELIIEKRANLAAVTLALGDGSAIESIADITPRYDMLVPGVVFTFISQVVDPATGVSWTKEDRQTAGATAGEGVVFATIDLSQQGGDTPETPPDGLAAYYLTTRNQLHWEGVITLHEQECSGLLKMGNVVNLSGGRPEWTTMFGLIQTVSEDIFNGRTVVTFGLPEHLSPQDFVAVMTQFRNRQQTGNFGGTQHNGTAGVPVDQGGVGSKPGHTPVNNPVGGSGSGQSSGPSTDADACKGGNPITIRGSGVAVP